MISNSDIIFQRRSIRKYKSRKPVHKDLIDHLIKAGMSAPSARNKQPWHFVISQNPKTLDILSERHPYAKMLKDASLAILVCGDKELDDNESYLAQNCAAATQNILLATHACGMGAVWLGVYPREERIKMCREVFDLPQHIIPVALISIGYPDEDKPVNDNFNQEKVHWEKWQG